MRYRFDPFLSRIARRYTRVYAKLAISVVAIPRRYLATSRQIARFENRISGNSGSTLRQNRNIEILRGSTSDDRRRGTAPPQLKRIYLAAILYIQRQSLFPYIFYKMKKKKRNKEREISGTRSCGAYRACSLDDAKRRGRERKRRGTG